MTITEASPAPVEQGSTTGITEGTGAQTGTVPVTQAETEVKFTQAQVDSIIKNRLAEQQQKLTSKLEKIWSDKLAAAVAEREQSLATQVEEAVQAKLNEHALTEARKAIQEEYSLTDVQLARLTGETPDDLKADAQTLFGALKDKTVRKPPILKTGGEANPEQPLDLKSMTPAQIREQAPEIRKRMLGH